MIVTLPKTYYNKNHEKQHSKEELMKKIKKLTSLLFCCLFLYLLAFPGQVQAASLTPTAQDNLSVKLRRSSDLISISNGYMRVFRKTNSVGIEYYDNSLQITDKREIPMELPLWGGFYAGSDGYYLVEGQNNTAEDNSAEVIRVIRYDTNWNRSGAASITSNPDLFGGEVRYPFDYGCVEMTETNGTLYIVTGHEGYVDKSVGQGHQGFLMIAVDQASMTGKIVSCDLWHSFAQYIKSQSSYLYVLEQSEGSRCTKLSRYDSTTLDEKTIELLPYGGSRTSVWALNCYASVDGMAVSADSVLCIGTTIDQSQYDNVTSDTPHNIYLTITPVSDFSKEATSVKYLTNYTGNGKSFMGVKITPITENRFMLMILFLPVLFITSLLMVREMYLAGNTPLLRPYPTASLSLKIPRLFTTPPMPILLIFTLLMQMTAQPPKRFTVLQVKMLPGILQMVFSPFPVRVHLISPRMKTIVSPFRPLRAATVSGAARHGSP